MSVTTKKENVTQGKFPYQGPMSSAQKKCYVPGKTEKAQNANSVSAPAMDRDSLAHHLYPGLVSRDGVFNPVFKGARGRHV